MTSRTRVRLYAAIAAACLVALAGCDATPTPSPSPTATVAPTPPETSLERQQREDFEAAEKAYRTFMAEYSRLAKAGGIKDPTPAMEATSAGPALKFYGAVLRQQKAANVKSTTGVTIGYVHPGAYSSNQLTLEVCEDGSSNEVIDSHGRVIDEGQILLRSAYMRRVDGRWKLWNGDERGTAKSCS